MNEDPVRAFLSADGDYRWEHVDVLRYKEEGAALFREVTRQTLFRRPDMRGELRYFEVARNGYSTLERHEHVHAVMILRGEGEALNAFTLPSGRGSLPSLLSLSFLKR